MDYAHLQNKLFELIDQASFDFTLPKLSRLTWETIINDNDERERQEFIGDFYMSAAVGENLCRCLPDGSPHQYTVARSALTSNSTYSTIMHRLGFNNPRNDRKSLGDAFESIIGAKKKEDLASLDAWFQTYYLRLLIYIADACRSLPSKGKKARPRPILALIRLRSIDHGSPVQKKRLVFAPRSLKKKGKGPYILKSPSMRTGHRVIDLTVDSDREDSNDSGGTDDDDIVQMSIDEFNHSPQILLHQSEILLHRSTTRSNLTRFSSDSVSTNVLGASTNPILID
ncbi:hypothetical protein J3R30DRAFT_3443466 [Lentinula aciculospora]|uniref:RNase III domain-containing protein n=1 Tax=Lentinula aciculospora TaxID=153920 RepID=A0A9W9AQI2_9AGAR|nr:hypothetical protein J3R30DRAFT_3443466 [Lentinula aciculospora]